MSGRYSDDSDSNWEDVFEDALESISESTESDDTEKLTKDFEVLQLSSQDGSEKSDDRASSSDSWQKCDAADLQDDTSCEEFPKTPDSRSSSDEESSRDEPIVVEKAPEEDQSDESAKKEEKDDKDSGPYQEAGTSGGFEIANLNLAISLPSTEEWDGVVKYLVGEPELNEQLKDIKENFNKGTTDESSCDEEEEDMDGLLSKKPKTLTREDIRSIVIEIMSGETSHNKTSRLYRAIIVTIFVQELGGKESQCHFFEIIASMLIFMDSGTRSLWLDLNKPIHSTLCDVFIDFLNKRCDALHKLELLKKQLQKRQKESKDENKDEEDECKSIVQPRQGTARSKYCGNYLRDPYDDMMWQMCGAWSFMWSPATMVRPGMWPPMRP